MLLVVLMSVVRTSVSVRPVTSSCQCTSSCPDVCSEECLFVRLLVVLMSVVRTSVSVRPVTSSCPDVCSEDVSVCSSSVLLVVLMSVVRTSVSVRPVYF